MPAEILLIDDDRFARQIYGDFLSAAGFAVATAPSGEAGLHLVRERSFDLVILDQLLPEMDGHEVLSALRVERPTLPVIMLTAFESEQASEQALEAGAAAFLVKPVGPAQLERAAHQALGQRAGGERPPLPPSAPADRAGLSQAQLAEDLCIAAVTYAGAGAAWGFTLTDSALERVASAGTRPPPEGLEQVLPALLEAAQGEPYLPTGLPGACDSVALAVPARPTLLIVAAPARPGPFPPEDLDALSYLCAHHLRSGSAPQGWMRPRSPDHLDPITGLQNGRQLSAALERFIALGDPGQRPIALVHLNIDRFDQINADHGDSTGNRLLAEVADLLRACVREVDTVYHLGADDFVCLLPDTGRPAAWWVAERARAVVTRARLADGPRGAIQVSATLGVVAWPQDIPLLDQAPTLAASLVQAARRRGHFGSVNLVETPRPGVGSDSSP